MRRLKSFGLLLFSLSLLALFCATQQDTSGVKYGKVYVSGENPVLRLRLNEQDKTFVTNASLWRIVYSPAGIGHICYITSDITGDGPSPDDVRAIFTDNESLLEYMNREIMTRYLKDPLPVHKATFTATGDSLKEWVEVVKSDAYTIVLIWRDFGEAFLVDSPIGGDMKFGISSLGIPAKKAEVYINGIKAVGRPFPEMIGKMQNSTARLWWAETWVK
ncbi:MAG: hypothetical protein A2W25_11535 [candidate division Zixibacteria bacterium RBG_16_53_22]|nr:MAG: hypothetical protein A2W25_11535 [candidate division Zixibacteria bacterium RBG_16_53_22]